jgi:hypothetical protein
MQRAKELNLQFYTGENGIRIRLLDCYRMTRKGEFICVIRMRFNSRNCRLVTHRMYQEAKLDFMTIHLLLVLYVYYFCVQFEFYEND